MSIQLFNMKREGALQSQARAEIELRGNCSVRSLWDSKLEMGDLEIRDGKFGNIKMGKWQNGH